MMSSKIQKAGIILMTGMCCLACSLSQELSNQMLKIFVMGDGDSNIPLQPWTDLCIPFGMAIGCLVCWIPLHLLGRRSTLELLSAPILIIGCCLTFTFNHLTRPNQMEFLTPYIHYIFVLGSCFQGISSGLTFIASPIYILESIGNVSSKPHSVSLLLFTTQLSTAMGILIANIFPVENETYFYYLLPAGFQILCLIGFYFLPESPRWLLIQKLRVEDAKKALRALQNYDNADYDICKELAEYQKDEEKYKRKSHDWIQQVTVYLHPLLMAIGLTCMLHLHGANVYDFYAEWTFKFSRLSRIVNMNATTVSLCIRTVSVTMNIVVFLISHRMIFHCILLMFSSGLVTIGLTITGTCFYGFSQGDTWTTSVSWLPLVTHLLFQSAFWLGPGSLAYITAILIVPIPLRPTILSLAGATYCLAGVLISRLSMPMINTLHPFGTFWFFAGMSSISLIFVMCSVVPEINRQQRSNVKTQSLVLRDKIISQEPTKNEKQIV